jgi:hypothetical protein
VTSRPAVRTDVPEGTSPAVGVASRAPVPPAWAWSAHVEVGEGWVVVPADVVDPRRWADETALRLRDVRHADGSELTDAGRAVENPTGNGLAEALAELAATAKNTRPILTALYREAGTPLAGLMMRPAPVAEGIDTTDALAAAWHRYPESLVQPDVRPVELAARPALRRLDRLPAPPAPDRRHHPWAGPTPVRELLTYVVLVEPGEALVVDAEWYHLGLGEHLEQQVDAVAATLRIDLTGGPTAGPTPATRPPAVGAVDP